ncbi:hypothetical protein BGZ61DRAFT_571861 [Ilyonectria robusta]|uniref:uncharacterized protein n=1 Tax=Ilyonectria robusta TaxID=1079257 RepID=UPI001E8EB948|nr:uncharacterized protein BGZ61DRAFT_571861 [Ilyonectria robusta]KAH8721751.1 hypothetical protein BGZ61DRAFT_571861 [Ilyonectria robusta]
MSLPCTCHVPQVSIGLDFGATVCSHSGVALASSRTCDAHPNQSSPPTILYSQKFPTVLRRQPGGQRFEFSQESQFPSESGDLLRYFKLALVDPAEQRNPPDVHAAALLQKTMWNVHVHETISELVSIYLQGLLEKVVSRLSRVTGSSLGACDVVISWPELWENNLSGSLDLLKEAVVLAGISPAFMKSVSYIKEHEAAVRSVLYYHGDELDRTLKDAAIYRHPDSTTGSDMIRPLCRVTGSVVLDVAFREKVVSRILGMTGVREESEIPVDVKRDLQLIMEKWHLKIKNAFDPFNMREGSVPFKIQGKDAIITRTEMMKMFDKVTDQIVAVIRELFKSSLDEGKTPGFIILTGGLSLNEYVTGTVRRRLEQVFSPIHRLKFIMGGPQAWTAVAQGAALSYGRPHSN